LRFDVAREPELSPGVGGLDGALARLFAIILTAQIDGTWPRLKACRNEVCRWAFYDASKNRSGHWCTMAICGSRRKTRAYRSRQREQG
jgi:predicted RNA-binding Zn ribbon-like protein